MTRALTAEERGQRGMAPLDDKDVAALTRACTYCGAKPGEDCISHKSHRAKEARERTTKPHYERRWRG